MAPLKSFDKLTCLKSEEGLYCSIILSPTQNPSFGGSDSGIKWNLDSNIKLQVCWRCSYVFPFIAARLGLTEILPFFVSPSNLFALFWFILVLEEKQCVSKISLLKFSSKMSIDGNLNNMSKENIWFRLILKSDLS